MIKMLLSVVVSLVPHRYRRAWFGDHDTDVKRGAILSGALQIVAPFAVLWYRYPAFLHMRMGGVEAAVAAKTAGDRLSLGIADFSIGFLGLWEYLFQPLSVLLIYFAFEGAVRLMAAVATREVVPTMPLAVLSWLHGIGEYHHGEIMQGPRIADDVVAGTSPEYDLRIDSCRAKPWTSLTTVRYRDELFEVCRQLTGPPPRPWVYMLKRMPAGKIVRGIHDYQPGETLDKGGGGGDSVPGASAGRP